MRILDKYLYKELTYTLLAVLAVLLLVSFGTETTRVLTMAIEGRIPVNVVFQVLMLKLPAALEVILPLAVLLAVMLAIGRLYQDQEMVVFRSCGIAESYFQKQVAIFLVPWVLITAFITLWLTPWAAQMERQVIEQAQVEAPLAGLVAGRFNVIPNNNGVLYAREIDSNGLMQEVWIRLGEQRGWTVLSAPEGRFELIEGRLALVLLKGYSYEGLKQTDELNVRQFDSLALFLPDFEPGNVRLRKRELTTSTLWQSKEPAHYALLQWRVVLPISILVLGLLALKMSKTQPRQGRFAKIFIAIILYVIYIQLLATTEDALAKEKLSLWIGMWWIPLIFSFFVFTDLGAIKRRLIRKIT
ncbi:LPS export ABC transporter permease LptF [Thiomicrospira microaerophila]|uniref:LPS export ABC transporter permease LptF n=1 Tax=Thiomicrospira microaerophila TaxID=406020 RepID=UPI00200BD669|nr:LPS export ABC transporter permease LptF [Thiomicrospira microaerophila]UQB42733.1 LPS export ABC transporter permease LptF [Thiomicrospira microaerophila]